MFDDSGVDSYHDSKAYVSCCQSSCIVSGALSLLFVSVHGLLIEARERATSYHIVMCVLYECVRLCYFCDVMLRVCSASKHDRIASFFSVGIG